MTGAVEVTEMSNELPGGRGRTWARIKLGAGVVAAILASAFVGANLHSPVVGAAGSVIPAAVVAAPAAPGGSYADLVSAVAPSVVTVRSERVVKPTAGQMPFADDPFLRRFFGDGFQRSPMVPRREGGLGSGVVVSADGYILTNHHVINDAQQIKVELSDKRVLSARLVGSDAPSDLAVLKVEGANLPALPMGNSDSVRVGDIVLAFGNPLGVGQTVTMGIISAKGRATGLGDGGFEDFLQTDAPINQGNSGGALVNTRGELVGINSQIMSPSGGNIGIGFAIPAGMARNVMAQLVSGGKVRRGLLGVTVQGVSSDVAKSLGLPSVKGALVSSVVPDGAAAKAGVERGDVIVAFGGAPVDDSNSLRNHVAEMKPGSEVTFRVWRNGQEKELHGRLGELDGPKSAANEDSDGPQRGALGLSVQPLTPEDARELGLSGRKGLLVAEVDPAGPAAAAGFQPGDVIEQVNGKPVSEASELRSAVKAAGDRPALVLVHRKAGSLFLTLSSDRSNG
jgi:Do/DeqQ family serine protease